jgi:predicted N-acyltransferase
VGRTQRRRQPFHLPRLSRCHGGLRQRRSSGEGGSTGWQAAPILIEDEEGRLTGALPAYIKSHSQGEYVFDHAWADAWQRAGGDYYPKLQIAVPFTPATGPRILTRDPALALPLLRAAETCASRPISPASTPPLSSPSRCRSSRKRAG